MDWNKKNLRDIRMNVETTCAMSNVVLTDLSPEGLTLVPQRPAGQLLFQGTSYGSCFMQLKWFTWKQKSYGMREVGGACDENLRLMREGHKSLRLNRKHLLREKHTLECEGPEDDDSDSGSSSDEEYLYRSPTFAFRNVTIGLDLVLYVNRRPVVLQSGTRIETGTLAFEAMGRKSYWSTHDNGHDSQSLHRFIELNFNGTKYCLDTYRNYDSWND